MIRFSFHKKLKAAGGEILLNVEGSIKKGCLATIYGASGAGKTSILRMMAGLLQPERGELEVNGQLWLNTSRGINLPPQQRRIGFVFQDYALFPNMTVKENLMYALDKKQDKSIVSELIETVELGNLQDRRPDTLSGGQKQRVALARALVRRPEILLLDEPLSALDTSMRYKLQDYILKVHHQFDLTTILVSHDVSEILKMSSHIIELGNGHILRQGTPLEIFSSRQFSSQFSLSGEVLRIEREDVINVVSVLIGNNLLKVVASDEETLGLSVGDRILVASAVFNPVLQKIE
jgi:molybdate transport system ATP-binding protein